MDTTSEYVEKVNEKGFVYWEHVATGEVRWENPYYQTNDYMDQLNEYEYGDESAYTYEEDGNWIMYYDEHGNGYWYNEATGESQWAETDADSQDYQSSSTAGSTADDEEDSDSDSEDDSEEDSDDSTDDSDEDDEDDEEFDEEDLEAKFQAMLQTPEGRAALEAEKQSILEEEARKEARKRRFDIVEGGYGKQRGVRGGNAASHVVVDMEGGDIEGGGWSSMDRTGKLNRRAKTVMDKGKVTFDLDEPPKEDSISKLEVVKEKWFMFKGVCREVTHKTKRWVTKTLQGVLLGAFSIAKYSLEYAEALTAEDENERVHRSEEGSESNSDTSDSDEEINPTRQRKRTRPKPPLNGVVVTGQSKGPPPKGPPPRSKPGADSSIQLPLTPPPPPSEPKTRTSAALSQTILPPPPPPHIMQLDNEPSPIQVVEMETSLLPKA